MKKQQLPFLGDDISDELAERIKTEAPRYEPCLDYENFNAGNITIMYGMFSNISTFNADIGGWDVSNVENMRSMFFNACSFDKYIGRWDVGQVEDMRGMFQNASAFNQQINRWDVRSVKDMGWMFFSASKFNQDISGWDVSNVENMRSMFWGAKSFDLNYIKNWRLHKSVRNALIDRPRYFGALLPKDIYDSLVSCDE